MLFAIFKKSNEDETDVKSLCYTQLSKLIFASDISSCPTILFPDINKAENYLVANSEYINYLIGEDKEKYTIYILPVDDNHKGIRIENITRR